MGKAVGGNRDRPHFLPFSATLSFETLDRNALMPRRARIVAAGYPMHAILRGIDRTVIFFADEDNRYFLGSSAISVGRNR